ncbi:MAG: M48 family metalloprotease, partial [bacterium]
MIQKIISQSKFSLLIFFLLQFFTSCATNPVTGKKELSLLSYSDEIRLGREADKEIVAAYGLYDNAQVSEYVNQLGQKMARISHRPDLEFHFRVLDSPVINAFALPGGYVYITRGILAYMNSEAELAGVMGHEIGHVTARHSAKQYTRAQLAQVGFGLGSIFSEEFRQFSDVAQIGVGLLFLKFSRDQERQSDQLGVEYSTRVGYDATNMSNFFGTLNRLQERSGQDLPGWFSTHPNPEEREAKTLQMAKEWQQKMPPTRFKVERVHYLNVIDGMVFGEDPRQGFVENGYFYHPSLDFQFPVPRDWQLNNSPQQVQMVNKNQDAAILFTLSQEASARSAAEKFLVNSKGRLIQSDYTKLNGLNTEIRITEVPQQQGNLRVLSYFIEKGGRVYVFHGFCSPGKFNNNLSTFKYTMTHFDRLKNRKAKNIKPTRIRVIKVTKGATLKSLLNRYRKGKLSVEELAIMNGMNLTDKVRPGDRIK